MKKGKADQTVKGRYVYIFRKGTAFHHQCATNCSSQKFKYKVLVVWLWNRCSENERTFS